MVPVVIINENIGITIMMVFDHIEMIHVTHFVSLKVHLVAYPD